MEMIAKTVRGVACRDSRVTDPVDGDRKYCQKARRQGPVRIEAGGVVKYFGRDAV